MNWNARKLNCWRRGAAMSRYPDGMRHEYLDESPDPEEIVEAWNKLAEWQKEVYAAVKGAFTEARSRNPHRSLKFYQGLCSRIMEYYEDEAEDYHAYHVLDRDFYEPDRILLGWEKMTDEILRGLE